MNSPTDITEPMYGWVGISDCGPQELKQITAHHQTRHLKSQNCIVFQYVSAYVNHFRIFQIQAAPKLAMCHQSYSRLVMNMLH